MPARARAAGEPDSLELKGRLEVQGGGLISSSEARQILGPAGGRMSRVEAEEALRRLGAILIRRGYLDASLSLWTARPPQDHPVLEVREGPAAHWDTLAVRTPAEAESLLAGSAGELPGPRSGGGGIARPRGPFRAGDAEELLERWIGLWADSGYPFAWVSVESLLVDEGRIRLGLRFDPGPACRVETVLFPGRVDTRDSFLRRWVRFRPGRLYDESEWQARRRRLEQSGLFLSVGAPRPEITADGTGRVLLPVEEGKHNRLEAAAGYSGAASALSYFGDLELGDLFGTGRFFRVRFDRLRRDDSRLRLQYHEPMLLTLPLGLRFSLEQQEQDSTYSLVSTDALAEASVGWDLTAFAGLEYQRALLGAEPSVVSRRTSTVVGGRWDTRSGTEWRGGALEGSFRSGRSHIEDPQGGNRGLRLVKGRIFAERFWPFPGGLLLRVQGLAEAIAGNDSLPVSEALRVGGAGSVRGYAEDSFATRRYALGQIELGLAWPQGRAYLFTDGGWLRRVGELSGGESVLAFGVGLSSQGRSQRVSIDLGIPRGAALSEGRLHLRLQTLF